MSNNLSNKLKDNYVYIFQMGKYFKIGVSNSPEGRLKNIDGTFLPEQPFLLYQFKTKKAYEIEKKLHFNYIKYKIRGEWFLFSESEIKAILEEYNFEKIRKPNFDYNINFKKIIKNNINEKIELINEKIELLDQKKKEYAQAKKEFEKKIKPYENYILYKFKTLISKK